MVRLRKKITFSLSNFGLCAFNIACIYFFLQDFWGEFLPGGKDGFLFSLCTILLWCIYGVSARYLKFTVNFHWLFVLLIMLFSSRENLLNGNYYWSVIYVILTLLLMFLTTESNWINGIADTIQALGSIHVVATIILFVFSPGLYDNTMALFWGSAPEGAASYMAGLCKHYSLNGTYCAIMTIFYWVKCQLHIGKNNNKKNIWMLILSAFALLLTTKRAHLLFSVYSIAVIYYLLAEGNKIKKALNLLILMSLAMICFFCLSFFVPIFGMIMDRFIGVEDISSGRFSYWKEAYDLFLQNKLVGIGWSQYHLINRHGTSVHNVYLQLLCETGIVGFSIFLLAMVKTYVVAIKDYRAVATTLPRKKKEMFLFSIAIQTFILAYCMTGNCLIDLTVIIYYLSCSISLAMHHEIRKKRKLKALYNL